MAEKCAVAFGRYLKTLRERRGLSLDDVLSLSKAFPEPVGKGYLSRCEHGGQRIAFSKLIALSRIYDVPSEVLVERMELDLELDHVGGGPETVGLSFEELESKGKAAAARGEMWLAYGYLRDALPLARSSPLLADYRDKKEQELRAIMNYSMPVARHGRHALALHELEYVRSVGGLSETHEVALMILFSQRYRALGHNDKASLFVDQAVASAEAVGSDYWRAFAYGNKALFAHHCKELELAVKLNQDAIPLFSQVGLHEEAARTQVNLAQIYFDQGRLGAARRCLYSAERIASRHDARRPRTLCRVLLGEIEAREGNGQRAVRLWREAIQMAKATHDHVLRFKAEFQLYKHALHSNDRATADSLGRILERRSSWVPHDVEELNEFRALSGHTPRKRVAGSQPH
jgi:tetratricopeptide (TPR) repeat protein